MGLTRENLTGVRVIRAFTKRDRNRVLQKRMKMLGYKNLWKNFFLIKSFTFPNYNIAMADHKGAFRLMAVL